MKITDESRRVGREIKNYLAVNRISREQFCFETKLGKSTVDKLITGLYSDQTLQIVLERTKFVRSNSFAAKRLGAYSRAAWAGYISDYLFLFPSIAGQNAISALCVAVEWVDNLSGLELVEKSGKAAQRKSIGALWIPHERSPLVYIQALSDDGGDSYGRYLIVATMVGEPAMRGVMLTVNNVVANDEIAPTDLGDIDPGHRRFSSYRMELERTLDKQFARLITPNAFPQRPGKQSAYTHQRS